MKGLFFGIICLLLLFLKTLLAGDIEAGKASYAQNCGNCHGPGGMGLASYPKIKVKKFHIS